MEDPFEILFGFLFIFCWLVIKFFGDWILTAIFVAVTITFVIYCGWLVWKCFLLLPTICEHIIALFKILIYSFIYSLALMIVAAANAAEVTQEEIFMQSAITGSKILLMEEKFYNLSRGSI